MNTRITILFFFTLISATAFSQEPRFSIATDLNLQHNFKKEQRFWTFGHATQAHFHLSPKNGIYVLFAYYKRGRFDNSLTAVAKSALTNPQQIHYTNSARMGIKQFSVGWRKYLKGSPDIEKGWNLYGLAGLGLLAGSVENTPSVITDTTKYTLPVRAGKAGFKRLTLDLGAGFEIPIGGDLYFYSEGKVWVPTTDYPSKYLFVNGNAPLMAMIGVGIRIIF